jgi:Fur family peroxide stress response transcriptional regulator
VTRNPASAERLLAACRRHRVPMTVQRRVVLEALSKRDDHPTADQVLEDVREDMPSMSRSTVYRVLDTLVRLGLAVKTSHPGAAVRFDPTTERHHHLICLRCEKMVDLHEPQLDALGLPDARKLGFEIRDYSIHFRGLCAVCRRSRGGNGHSRPARRRT